MTLLALALAYGAQGWPVFPLEPHGKQPLGRLVPHGLKDASTDAEDIRRWWTEEPNANIGICTGEAFDVADLDSQEVMEWVAKSLAEQGDDPLRFPRAKTGGGGRHIFVAPTGHGNSPPTVPDVLKGSFHWRGKGGYIVAPGSVHPNGQRYEWISEPNGNGFPKAPTWLLSLLKKDSEAPPNQETSAEVPDAYAETALTNEISDLRTAREGERNEVLNRAAFSLGQLVGAGLLARGRVEAELKAAAYAVRLDEPEVSRTIRSGLESGRKEPRQIPERQNLRGGEIITGGGAAEFTEIPPDQAPPWPTALGEDAFHGLVGRMVAFIAPYVESDEPSTLAQFLTAFGIAVGQQPHFMVGATRHAPTTYLGLVGRTSRARKGTSWDPVRTLFRGADSGFGQRVVSGVGSGERLVYLVRDERYEVDKNGIEQLVDSGAKDRRLLLQESELARLLTVINREASTMSAYLRVAYDGQPLRNEVKTNGSISSVHHIGLVGHCTAEDLIGQLKEQEIRNGLANRVIWILVRRDKKLPDPPLFEGPEVEEAISELREMLGRAEGVGRLRRHAAAQRLWNDWYLSLADDETSLLGAITNRAEAQVIRFSMIYALTDGSEVIGVDHLRAAIALWEFSVRCAAHIFGASTGNLVADRILEALRQQGSLLRSEITHEIFGRNLSAQPLLEAQRLLERRGLMKRELLPSTGGRRPERWSLR